MSLQIHIITIHPTFVDSYKSFGVIHAAKKADMVEVNTVDLREFAVDKHGSVDDAPYGGGDGMVMRPDPLAAAVKSLENPYVVLTSPGGRLWRQKDAFRYGAWERPLVFICGRFAGVDQRFIDKYVDEEISLGDFVVSGGELPTLMIVDSILRTLPGVLGNQESALNDSFSEGLEGLLEYPNYTRPREFEGMTVPEVLLSGDHARIAKWRKSEVLKKTLKLRPDLLDKSP